MSQQILAGSLPPRSQIRHTDVVKIQVADDRGAEGRTREALSRLLLEGGSATAASLSAQLRISATATRRHLDSLIAEGRVVAREPHVTGQRTRGRPAKVYALTETGREKFPHAYDDLAVSALRFIQETGGQDAVMRFAEQRIARFSQRHSDDVQRAGNPTRQIRTLAKALSDEGYAASAHSMGGGGQLCQHHCPVEQVAAEFPQLCEVETRAFEQMLGTHVQRLATIARGDEVCTTYVPTGPNAHAARNRRTQSERKSG